MKCPQCQSPKIVKGGEPISSGGSTFYPRKCEKCGYFWSERKPLPEKPPAAALPPVRGVPPAGGEELPPANFDAPGAFDVVPAEEIKQGDVIRFKHKGYVGTGPVVGITDKTFVVDFGGVPDTRIRKSALIGRVSKG